MASRQHTQKSQEVTEVDFEKTIFEHIEAVRKLCMQYESCDELAMVLSKIDQMVLGYRELLEFVERKKVGDSEVEVI
jgi:hypothetical protein